MIKVKGPRGTLAVDSMYDSGTHNGFGACIIEDDGYSTQTLDQFLDEKEIAAVEAGIFAMISQMIEAKAGKENKPTPAKEIV
ncbi:hypothetical protein D3C85_1442740 [compost metagenome]